MKKFIYLLIVIALSTAAKAETRSTAPGTKYSTDGSACKELHSKKSHFSHEIETVERKPVLELGTENVKFSINKDVHLRNGEIENTKLQFSGELRLGDFSFEVSLSSERLDVFITC
jgi:hypothetical protein